MNRKLFLFSGVVALLCVIIFISHTRMSGATTLFTFSESDGQRERVIPAGETESRIMLYGKQCGAWLDKNVPNSMVPSAAIGVIQGDRLVYHHGVRADSTTRFGIASLSKTFTAVLALRLQEGKILSLDDPVRKYLPQVVIERHELRSDPVTIRHLLAHTSGIPCNGSRHVVYDINGKKQAVPVQVHPAGYCYSYSNEGYELLLHVIEAATGRSYAEAMKELVFDPLEMDSSTAEFSNGTGGIVSTVQDLAKYASMLISRGRFHGKTILSGKSFDAMLANPVEMPPMKADYYYSLSWEVITVGGEIDSYYKAGRWFSQASGLQVFPKKNIAFIYLCNPPEHLGGSFMSWRQGLTGMLRFLVRKISGDDTLCTVWPSLSAEDLRRYEGSYRNVITGETVRVSLRGGTLYSNGFGGFRPLRTFTSNRFLIDSGRMLHNFVWRDNHVVGLALRHGYYETVHQ
jgi:CubicO group peptidase (beta-lactamase class C family)